MGRNGTIMLTRGSNIEIIYFSRSHVSLRRVPPCWRYTTLIMAYFPSCTNSILLFENLQAHPTLTSPWYQCLAIYYQSRSRVVTRKTGLAMWKRPWWSSICQTKRNISHSLPWSSLSQNIVTNHPTKSLDPVAILVVAQSWQLLAPTCAMSQVHTCNQYMYSKHPKSVWYVQGCHVPAVPHC